MDQFKWIKEHELYKKPILIKEAKRERKKFLKAIKNSSLKI